MADDNTMALPDTLGRADDPCGAYPERTTCVWCETEDSAHWVAWGVVQGAHYVCEREGCERFMLLIDSCECPEEDDPDVETCSWCTTQVRDDALEELEDGARVCPQCLSESEAS